MKTIIKEENKQNKIEWNKVYFKDCLDKDVGLPKLAELVESGEMEKIDLCLTDPQWNVGYKRAVDISSGRKMKRDKKFLFNDNIENYEEWCKTWFSLLQQITKTIIMIVGAFGDKISMWCKIHEPKDFIFHHKPNAVSHGRVSFYNKVSMYLIYGKTRRWYHDDYFKQNVGAGFLSYRQRTDHNSPKSTKLWKDIIQPINPETIIDPFLGSGTILKACKLLDIDYIGYEIKKEYKDDIQRTLNSVNTSQSSVMGWVK